MSARERMVTRTVIGNNYNVTVCDTVAQTVNTVSVTVNAAVEGKALEKAIRSAVETETVKAVMWVVASTTETLYAMPEDEFIRLATPLPPRKPAKEPENT